MRTRSGTVLALTLFDLRFNTISISLLTDLVQDQGLVQDMISVRELGLTLNCHRVRGFQSARSIHT